MNACYFHIGQRLTGRTGYALGHVVSIEPDTVDGGFVAWTNLKHWVSSSEIDGRTAFIGRPKALSQEEEMWQYSMGT